MPVASWLRGLGSGRQDPIASLRLHLEALSAAIAAQRAVLNETRKAVEPHEMTLKQAIGRLEEVPLEDVKTSVSALHASLRRQVKLGRALEARQRVGPGAASNTKVHARLSRIAAAGQPILVGPWTADVGMEVLYWAPFIRWFASHYRIPPAQLHVVSRGGAPFYNDIAEGYTDILSMFTASEFRTHTARQGRRLTDGFGRRIARQVPASLGGRRMLLHPALMHRLFEPYWNRDAPLKHVTAHTVPKRLPPPALALTGLPERFVAVRFAFSAAFPDTPANRTRLDALLASLTQSHQVVWLGPGIDGVDGAGQSDYVPAAGLPMHHIDPLPPSETSLAELAAVIARADAYVGTYGGLSYLASFYNVRSVTFYSVPAFFPHYRGVADHVLGVRDNRSLTVLNVANAALIRRVLGIAPGSAAD